MRSLIVNEVIRAQLPHVARANRDCQKASLPVSYHWFLRYDMIFDFLGDILPFPVLDHSALSQNPLPFAAMVFGLGGVVHFTLVVCSTVLHKIAPQKVRVPACSRDLIHPREVDPDAVLF